MEILAAMGEAGEFGGREGDGLEVDDVVLNEGGVERGGDDGGFEIEIEASAAEERGCVNHWGYVAVGHEGEEEYVKRTMMFSSTTHCCRGRSIVRGKGMSGRRQGDLGFGYVYDQ